jgi:hypothetical protein
MENLNKTEKSKTIPIDIPGRERLPEIISKEDWEELSREEFDDDRFAEENGMDSVYWCPACKLGVCEIRGHD